MGDTSARTLPPETTDKIIDYLHDIPTALVSSSLVQKSWTNRAQWWLYTKIFLRDRQAYASLLRLKRQPRTRTFLKDQCGHTTRLEITDDKGHPYAHAFPLPFINLFPALTALAYHDAQWSHLHPDPTILDSLSTFSSVATLELHACRFSKFRDFVRVICALRSLHDLTIVETSLGKASLPVNLNTIEPTIASLGKELRLSRLHAQHLVSDETSLTELLSWVSMTPSADEQRIQTLVIHPRDLTSGTSFHGPLLALLRQLGSSLSTLDIPVLPQSLIGMGIPVGLNTNDHLQSLVLRYTFRDEWEVAWANIGQMLSTITSASLQTLELVFTIYRAAWIDIGGAYSVTQSKDSWGLINGVLGSGALSKLQKATITLEWYIEQSLPDAEVKRLQVSIEEGMKGLEWSKRGILSITHNEHSWDMQSAVMSQLSLGDSNIPRY